MPALTTTAQDWLRFLRKLALLSALAVAGLFISLALIDPYDALPWSLPGERYRVTGNERYAFPSIARDQDFDSAVFGTSTSMLLKPSELNRLFGGRFANLAMGSATAWEQSRLMRLFAASRPHAGTVIIGIDTVWCAPRQAGERLTFRPFPPWQYDANAWNDYLHLLNARVIVHSARLVAIWTGLRAPRFGADGYFQFVPTTDRYERERARRNLYPSGEPLVPAAVSTRAGWETPPPADWRYPDLSLLERALGEFPPATQKVVFFAANHVSLFNNSGAWKKFYHCKQGVVELATRLRNVSVVDFMFPSRITSDDDRYWDPLHYTIETASEIATLLARTVNDSRSVEGYTKLLSGRGS